MTAAIDACIIFTSDGQPMILRHLRLPESIPIHISPDAPPGQRVVEVLDGEKPIIAYKSDYEEAWERFNKENEIRAACIRAHESLSKKPANFVNQDKLTQSPNEKAAEDIFPRRVTGNAAPCNTAGDIASGGVTSPDATATPSPTKTLRDEVALMEFKYLRIEGYSIENCMKEAWINADKFMRQRNGNK